MANIAVIPARGGSKRIPKKNIKMFNGKPIIAYVIETVLATNLFDEVMVSTDSEEVAVVAKKYGAKVPFFRSQSNSDDFATLTDVLQEVTQSYEKVGRKFDNICCILPTAALITSDRIKEGLEMLKSGLSSLVPVIRFSYPIQRALQEKGGLLKMREVKHLNTRSQDLEPFYHDSGQFYWLKTKAFLVEEQIFTKSTGLLELQESEVQDVDTLEDWKMLELKYKLKN